MASVAVYINRSVTRFAIPRPHDLECPEADGSETTTLSSYGTYSLMTDGAPTVHNEFALFLLEQLWNLYKGDAIDLADEETVTSVAVDLGHLMQDAGGLSPVVCDCSERLILHLGQSACVWDGNINRLRRLNPDETFGNGGVGVVVVNDPAQLTERALSSLANRHTDVKYGEAKKYGVGPLVYSAVPVTDEPKFAGAVVSALYSAHRAHEALNGNPMTQRTNFNITRFSTSAQLSNLIWAMDTPPDLSAQDLSDTVEDIFNEPLPDSREMGSPSGL